MEEPPTLEPEEEQPAPFVGQTFIHPNGIYAVWNPEPDMFIPVLRMNPQSSDLTLNPTAPVCRTIECANNFHSLQEQIAKDAIAAGKAKLVSVKDTRPIARLNGDGMPLRSIHPNEFIKRPKPKRQP